MPEHVEPTLMERIQQDPVGAMASVLDITGGHARTSEDIFTGMSIPMPSGRIFGGQVLAQSMVAASRTLPDERRIHSMHGYFLRPGDASQGLTLSVDRIHDGRSFATRRVQAYQNGAPIFSMIASFQDEDPGVEHQAPMPEGIPRPDELQDAFVALGPDAMRNPMFRDRPFEYRYVQGSVFARVDGEHVPHQALWVRTKRRLPDDVALHRATLAFLSDMTIQESVLRAHGIPWATPGLKVASLDHAMWWHRDARVDEWLLYVQESPSARGGRGLATGRIYAQDGTLAASVAQEIMVRVPDGVAHS